jgi:DNA primase
MDQVEEIKNKVDIVQLVGEYVKLTKAGRNFKGLCPFHGEKTPSFMVNPELQIYKCFGCGEGGDVYAFLQKMEGMEFSEALTTLAKKTGVVLKTYMPTKGEEERERLLQVNNLAAEYYHYLLTKHELGQAAKEYLQKRGIGDEAITRYKLGFAPDGWDFLAKFLVGKKGFTHTDLERAGLEIPGTRSGQEGYDRFRNRVMFPLNNHRGQTVGFAGRVMPGADEKSGGKYVNTPETEIYHKGDLLYGLDVNKAEIKTKGSAVIVEGEVDSIASALAGVGNVVAIKGSALTAKQVELLKRYTETIILALDADLAGDMAARKGIEMAEKAGMIIKVVEAGSIKVNPKKYKDPGEWGVADPEGWRTAVEEAVPIYDFYIGSAVERYGLDAVGKMKIGKELLPIFARIEDEITRGHYIKKLAGVLDVEEEDVRRQLQKVANKLTGTEKEEPGGKEARRSRREVMEEYLTGFALRNGKLTQLLEAAEWFGTEFWKKVIESIKEETKKGTTGIPEVINALPPELKKRAEELMLWEDEPEEEDTDREWARSVAELEEAVIREKLAGLTGQNNKSEEVAKLVTRLNELTK